MDANIQLDAIAEAAATPLDKLNIADPKRFADDTIWPFFARMRREAPVHYCADSPYGPYWSLTRYQDILETEINHAVFSSDTSVGGIQIEDQPKELARPSFIRMDPPKHDEQRKVVSPIVAPANLALMETIIRQRAGKIMDELPRNETFDWVDRVSIELTIQMLATLFDYPFEDRRQLTYWSDVAVCNVNDPTSPVHSEEERFAELKNMALAMTKLWNERVNAPPQHDLISMLAHGEATRNMPPNEFMGTLGLLIVGGNDTTRNSISGGLHALSQNPEEFRKLRENPGLIPNMVSEIIRWQTPVAHMRRTAIQDIELHGKKIRAGDKVVMWYMSGNRDETMIPDADRFIIDRPRARQHLSFGFGIHRCVGNRLAEMQLRIVWEELLARFPVIEVVSEPERVLSNFLRGIKRLDVRIPA
jgi:cytochrome P450